VFALGEFGLKDKQALTKKVGAHEYVDTGVDAPAEALQTTWRGAADSSDCSGFEIDFRVGGWACGKWAATDCGRGYGISFRDSATAYWRRQGDPGMASGTAKDSEETLRFSSLTGVRPMIERYPLDKAAEAYDQMISGRARFRVVLTMGA
jgi:D-arabinose 1-dehydrogenase-like Zn-dependent alcohol dehydrogenase